MESSIIIVSRYFYSLIHLYYSYKRNRIMKRRFGLKQKYINLGGHKLHYFDSEGDGPVLVLIHGLLDTSFGFRKIITHLPRNYRLIIPDIPGFGKSKMPNVKFLYQVDIFAELIYESLLDMGIESCTVAGHSMGGLVALNMALQDKFKLINRLVLIASTVDPHPHRDEMRKLLFPSAEHEILDLLQYLYYENIPEPDRFFKNALVHLWNTPPFRYLAENSIARENEIFFGKKAGKVRLPTLILAGKEDKITTPAMMKKLKGYIKGSKLKLIPGARHAIHMEKGMELAKEISRFAG